MHIIMNTLSASVSEKRPQNKTCVWCGEKRVTPELRYGKWTIPPKKKVCDSCFSLDSDEFETVRTKRKRVIKSDKDAENHLPLMMIDDAKRKTQVYTDLRSLRRDIKKKLDEGYRKSDLRIIDRKNYNLNDYFL
jgi:hypothetical protein